MTKLRHERAPACVETLRRVIATKQPVLMVWPHEAGSQSDPVLVDEMTAKKLVEVYRHQDEGVQSEMEKMVASRRATFESLYRQLFGGHTPDTQEGRHSPELAGEPMLIDVLMAHREALVPLESVPTVQPSWVERVSRRIKGLWHSTSRQLASLPW